MKSNKTHMVRTNPILLRFIPILLAFCLHGCAGKPWTSPVAENETAPIIQTFMEMQQQDASCFCCLDAKTTLTWDGPGEDRTVAGYLQLMLPTSLKFVVLNPLGQPLYAMVSDGQEFQSINTTLKQHTIGKISSLASQHKIPGSLLSQNWGYWLMGRLQEKGTTIETIRKDSSNRGVWITMQYPEGAPLAKTHLLIQPETKQLLARILVDHQGDTIATITYEGQKKRKGCAPAGRITITDLPYGSKLQIDFADILTDRSFTAANFRLKVPADYNVQTTGDK
jgi:hypothetical protein